MFPATNRELLPDRQSIDRATRKHHQCVRRLDAQTRPPLPDAVFQGTDLRLSIEPRPQLPKQLLPRPHARGVLSALRSSPGTPVDGKLQIRHPPWLPGQTFSWTPANFALFPPAHFGF